nr:heme lyase CcmF/NrfE family subunit [Sphingomicrobium nitratireducens]
MWLAAALALLQLGLGITVLRGRDDDGAMALAMRALAVAQGALTLFAFLSLILLFWRTDLSVELVAAHSASAKPWLYKVAGTWGNHEGSMLLWVMVMSLSGAGLGLFARRLDSAVLSAALGTQAAIGLGFFAFLLFASNPFARLNPPAVEGRGLNPVLQDPGLAFHPPTLYFGYVGLSVAFSIAIAGMLTDRVGPALARAMRPWVLASWVLLTAGIVAGSYWAYYELGWGGYWFWDPVENASLMPWLAATALLHSVSVLAARSALKAWTMMLALVAFSMSMVGTFLVRSGIITSVHAFAVDPLRGSFILALLALYVGGAMALFGWKIGGVREGERFDLVSREGALVANNLLLSVILALVFIGTLYPLAAEALDERISVGPPYFNTVVGPLALLLGLLLYVGPLLGWRRHRRGVPRSVALSGVIAAASLVTMLIVTRGEHLFACFGMAVAAGLAVASLSPLFGRRLGRVPMATWGMAVAHFGVAVSLAGMASEAAFTKETLVRAQPGEIVAVGSWQVELHDVMPVAGPNWSAIEAELRVSRGDGVEVLRPQSRAFASPPTVTSEAALSTHADGQLYAVLGDGREGEGWQLRLWWKPFVTLIWWGGLLIALGGLLALVGRTWREGRRARAIREPARW